MKIERKDITVIVFCVLAIAYLITSIIVFNKPDESNAVCQKVNINIADETANGFINQKEILSRLQKQHLYPQSKPIQFVNARQIENTLLSTPFVKSAECYKTQGGDVNITITQRMPTLRIKSDNGDDYYLDDNNSVMPNSNYTSDLIIATGNISRKYAQNYVSYLCNSLMKSDFWRNQIEQVNILPNHVVEIVPRVGDHIVCLGQMPESKNKTKRQELIDEFVDKKLSRLEKFYKYGLSQAGWNKYSYINLEFDNQIICKKRNSKI